LGGGKKPASSSSRRDPRLQGRDSGLAGTESSLFHIGEGSDSVPELRKKIVMTRKNLALQVKENELISQSWKKKSTTSSSPESFFGDITLLGCS